jgi:hypothetical protein
MRSRRWIFAALAAASAALAPAARAERRTLKWDDDACSYRGTSDDQLLPEAETTMALKLLRESGSVVSVDGRNVLTLPPDPADGTKDSRLSAAQIETLCAAEDKRLAAALPHLPKSDALRKRRLDDLRAECRIARVLRPGWDEPAQLRKLEGQPPECLAYVDALEKPELRRAAWDKLNAAQAANNASPEGLLRDQRKRAADFGDAAIKYDLLTYGWYNCALAMRHEEPVDLEPAERELESKLKNFKKTCEEGD